MMNASKYKIGYFPSPEKSNNWVERDHIEKPPVWCSVDMRDGNQSLIIPMSLEEKIEYYKVLLDVGFKEIEVGFPAASDTEYEFLRTLIDKNMIPSDVSVQVLTQCREHIIRKTFEACKGAPSAIIHFYNSVSVAQRNQVFKKSKDEIKQIAIDGAKLVKKLSTEYEGNFRFEYSPESFTGTEPEYALEVCNAVLDILEPSATNNVIINLPATVEMSLPHIYASQVEYMSRNLKYREFVTLSLHPHNDRGTSVADTELALLAGADRVEGTLFGNGERTGNVDIITLAMNMYAHGVDPKLDFSDIPYLVDKYEKCTRMNVYARAPYAGSLVFAAFSGSHQDAIAKGMKYRSKNKLNEWSVPYIPIDPKDIGRTYDSDVIRVNSQSGKGGIGYLLEYTYGYILPPKMREHLSYLCKGISDREHKELKPEEVLKIFTDNYLNVDGNISVTDFDFMRENNSVKINISFMQNGIETELEGEGNGSLSAVSNALKAYTGDNYLLQVFTQHSMQGEDSQSVAASYIGIENDKGEMFWGAGTDTDIIKASTNALLSAYNNMTKGGND
ncbi:MAG TPA: 2-isopropylmalate synthase [bacterium]|jgi:2-isopropylmalate synthase|nr:2-isopropylmalate synthase [Saccharofermentans sp.]HOX40978.1 2-isopropylmalate synthase [bacterium]HPE27608.1 2-isopropylmalate synthase [Saccharofermentans sp.]HPQ31437.1 2-isopropylmalate synthase [Saccharofermentans sp.]HRV50553.1 2-isopropylmalate synthase [Saccharofermentans sp.]